MNNLAWIVAKQRWAEWHGMSAGAEWEIEEIVDEAEQHRPIRVVLEIGAHSGASLRIWEAAFEPDALIGVESEDSERVRFGRHPGDGLDSIEARGAHIIYGSSHDYDTWVAVKGVLAGRQVDFLYIDGGHRYDAVKRDFHVYGCLVRPGGLIVLDDAATVGVIDTEVYRVVPEIQLTHRTKLIAACTNPDSMDTATGKLLVYAR